MKSGLVAVVGRPNVGKSSLLNKIVDFKVSITTDKPQTTRYQIKAIYNDKTSQIVFIDTPGIHKPKQHLGTFLNNAAYRATKDANYILFLNPIDEALGPGDKRIIKLLPLNKCLALITKIDKGDIKKTHQRVEDLKSLGFKNINSVTIKNQVSIKNLLQFIKSKLEEGPALFDHADITDVSTRFLIQEMIRESAIEKTYQELPHAIKVVINEIDEGKTKWKVAATIFVEKNSQKRILVGKNGDLIKKIGITSRIKIKKLINKKLYLDLKVKVDANWTNNSQKIIKNGF